jgi:hypothetical protein
MQYLSAKEKRPIFQVLLPFIIAVGVSLLIFDINLAQYNSFYIFVTLICAKRLENKELDYETYKAAIKKYIYLLGALGIILLLLEGELANDIFRFYLVYLVSAVIVLREVRKFSSKISDKKSLIISLIVVSAIMLLSIENIYNFVIMILSYVCLGMNFVLDKILTVVIYIVIFVLYKPLHFILQLFFSHLILKKSANNKPTDIGFHLNRFSQNLKIRDSSIFLIIVVLKIIIVLLMIYLMVKAFDVHRKKSSYEDMGVVKKEKIFRQNRKNNLFKSIKLFREKKDMKTEILNLYLKFENKMNDKEIYKPYMTAEELSSAAKAQIDDKDAINSITSIYNEAKFSSHEINKENVKMAKSNYESIRKKI